MASKAKEPVSVVKLEGEAAKSLANLLKAPLTQKQKKAVDDAERILAFYKVKWPKKS